jgi:hypothetical protein
MTIDDILDRVGLRNANKDSGEVIAKLSIDLAKAHAELRRLRAVLDAAKAAAEAGQWTACRDALQGADHA